MVRAPFRSAVFGLIAAFVFTILPTTAVTPVAAVSPNLVISQVYGGGGNTGATFNFDFVELFNRGSAPASLDGMSIQYASATGTGNLGSSSTALTELPNAVVAPGQYFLVSEASGAIGAPLPTPDFADLTPITMSATAGKVVLATGATSLGCNGGSAPCDATALARIVDLVGYGGANFYETAPTAALSNPVAALRNDEGCTETDNNAADFSVGTPTPRNTATAPNPCNGPDDAPTVTASVPASAATDVAVDATISLTFSESVTLADPAATISCTASGSHTAALGGSATAWTLDPDTNFLEGETCTVTVTAAAVTDVDTNDPPDTLGADHVFSFDTVAADVCAAAFTPVYSIQGSGASAAITGNVTTQGVVVGDFEGTAAASGFYLQDATGDGNAATSDGIFVLTGNSNLVTLGDVVRVSGIARERFNQTAITGATATTPILAAGVVNCGSGAIDPTEVNLPFARTTSPEAFEGMLVRLPQGLVISEYFNYERFGEIVLARPLDGETRAFTPTLLEEPGADAQARAQANLLSRITLDDVRSAQNPPVLRHPNGAPFSLTNRFRGGDLVTNTVGVLGWDFSLYRIFPTAPAEYTASNPRPAAPAEVGGRIKVAAMNTLNYFLTGDLIQEASNAPNDPADDLCGPVPSLECRGWDGDQPLEFDRQRDKLIAAIGGLDADVVGLNELENTLNVDPLGDPDDGIVAGLNDVFGAGTYDSIDTGVLGTDAIKVGVIYRPAAVTPVGDFAVLTSTVDPRFNTAFNRPALAQTFEENATGARFTVVVNHLKSKGSDCNAVGDPDIGDGAGNCNLTREAAAQALVDWIASDPTGSGDRDYLIVGDLNSYAKEDPIDAIRAGPDDAAGTADDYSNLISKFGGEYAYSFVFDGQAGYLDHALSSATMTAQVTGATEWHINADEPDLLDYDTSFKPGAQEAIYESNAYRASDHDPVVVGLDLLEFGFEGFFQPLSPAGTATANAGSALPIRFHLTETTGLDVLWVNPVSYQVSCDTGAPTGNPANTGATVGLTQDASGSYTYDWKTAKSWGGTCRQFEITFDDGTYRTAVIHFVK